MPRFRIVLRFVPVATAVSLVCACALLAPFAQVYDDMSPTPSAPAGRAESFEGGSSWVTPSTDGGFLIVGWPLANPRHLLVRRTDAAGAAMWEQALADLPATP